MLALFHGIGTPRLTARGFLRLFGFFSVLAALLSVSALRTARATIEQRAEDMGKKLVERLGPMVIGEPQALEVNGQNVFLASTVTKLSPPEVIERMEQYCREQSGNPGQGIGELPRAVRGKPIDPALHDPAGWLTAKSDVDGEYGHITCFAEDNGSTRGFIERLTAFMDTDDLSSFGDFRYTVARRTEAGTTHVLTLWTEGSFNLFKMFPESGDAPGTDAPNAPRPPQAVRLLSARAESMPHSLRVYESEAAPAEVLAFYDRQLPARGFEALSVWLESPDDPAATPTPSYARAFYKNGGVLIVTALEEPVLAQSTQVTITELASQGRMESVLVDSVDP